ncbi:nicotinate-nucleotide adenylyltransferase [uncultured Xylophilus sp.]|uniref:nicotinate-nucleotide adenylyltransferase n=1 Tax=uncultured Xylophilus sp. TaxID=296832 RepID=UPI0025E43F6B|nr:nicotinate-nucleotide adenylyltransferase [uncultured Xylophilus sp.]
MGVSTAAERRRIGLFGGAFDPPHCAHVALAQQAIDELALDLLHVVPTGRAWHKKRTLSPAHDRLAMVQAAFASMPKSAVDERELRRPGPSYTIDTLTELQAQYPDAQLYLLIGADQAGALTQWHGWAEVVRLAIISIARRPDAPSAPGPWAFETSPDARTVALHLPDIPINATQVRDRVAAGQPIDALVPPAVAGYIDFHHLYRPAR